MNNLYFLLTNHLIKNALTPFKKRTWDILREIFCRGLGVFFMAQLQKPPQRVKAIGKGPFLT